MLIYAGIDEAGYGPMFGPFVIARSVIAIEDHPPVSDEPPCLWTLLDSAVCRAGRDKRRRIAVDDSKKVYTPSAGLANLERGVMSFAHLAANEATTLDELLASIGLEDSCRTPGLLWYHDDAGEPRLPTANSPDQIRIAAHQLRRAAESTGVSLADTRAAVIYEDRFNEIVAATRSKAACGWRFIAKHLWDIWQCFGEHAPWVVVDRQGGRKVYHPQLQLLFEGAELRLLDESDNVSRYRISRGDRRITISFETGGDGRHLPAALASMTAKYVRELLMVRFNRFWRAHAGDIRPTAGYVRDGRRFLAEIEMHIDRLNIDRHLLVRSR